MDLNDEEAWQQIRKIALLLVQRKDPSQADIGKIVLAMDTHGYIDDTCICFLCEEVLPYNTWADISDVRQHFFLHVKEASLLPFI